MRIAVTDASIFIDLIDLGWIRLLPQLDCEIVTTYNILAELYDWQQTVLEEIAREQGLVIHAVQEEELNLWKESIETAKRLSHPDLTVLWLAAKMDAMVLTGDKLVRTTSIKLRLEVHGLLWLFDRFLETQLTTHSEACTKLEKLMETNDRLPREECEKRLAKWNDQMSAEVHFPITAIVLAAGLSSRMGAQNKLLLPFGGATILEATLEQLAAAGPGEILVVTGHEQERVHELLKNKPYRLVENPDYRQGMSSSIKAGVAAARPDAAGFMICLADMPLIRAAEYNLLAESLVSALKTDPDAIIQPRFGEQAGNPVLFSARYRAALLALEYPEGARPVVQANRKHIVPVQMPTEAVLRDADTPEAYQTLLQLFS